MALVRGQGRHPRSHAPPGPPPGPAAPRPRGPGAQLRPRRGAPTTRRHGSRSPWPPRPASAGLPTPAAGPRRRRPAQLGVGPVRLRQGPWPAPSWRLGR
eukprot:4908515-Lingulodinium_polyedra.AAC.1